MLQYSFVKNNTFNGTALPDIALLHEDGGVEVVHRFGYKDFRGRLG
jgi:carboxynorspermidine decarboxylase